MRSYVCESIVFQKLHEVTCFTLSLSKKWTVCGERKFQYYISWKSDIHTVWPCQLWQYCSLVSEWQCSGKMYWLYLHSRNFIAYDGGSILSWKNGINLLHYNNTRIYMPDMFSTSQTYKLSHLPHMATLLSFDTKIFTWAGFLNLWRCKWFWNLLLLKFLSSAVDLWMSWKIFFTKILNNLNTENTLKENLT